MDRSARFIFVRVCLANNDREALTASPIYLYQSEYFGEDEFVASDGGFEGDGPFRCSFKNPGGKHYKVLYNLTFKEVRTGVEGKYARVSSWFSLLGNQIRKNWHTQKGR